MERRMWIIAILISSHAVELIIAQTQWTIKTTSKFEIYISSSNAANYDAAKQLCVDNAGTMVRLDDAQVRSTVYAAIQSSKTFSYFWVGATGKLLDWKWLDGTRVQDDILVWYAGQPENYHNNEPRLLLRFDGKYGDIQIAFSYAKTICLRKTVLGVNNRILTIYRHNGNGNPIAVNYNTAQSQCASRSSRLAVLDDTTRSILIAHLKQNEYHWFATPDMVGCRAFAKNMMVENCSSTLAYVCETAAPYAVTTADLMLNETSAQEISCTADGFPVPNVVWKKDDVTIPDSSNDGVYQINSHGLAKLITKNAKLTDEGEYHCVASNTFDGSKHERTANAQLKVPSTPTILSIEPQSCNSSFIIKWKPHARAVGVEHSIRIRRNEMPYEEQVTVTPGQGEQNFASKNLSSFTLYSVQIYTCKSCPNDTYVDHKANYAGGIPRPVQAAVLLQANDSCMVNWTWPANTPRHLLTGFKVKTRFTTARVPAGTNVSTEMEETMTNSTPFNITMRPNRNHTVTITSRTCAGFGKEVVAAGGCVSKVAAPTSIPKPTTRTWTKTVSDNGKLSFVMTVPSQINGAISCVFVIIETGKAVTVTRFNETLLRNANGTDDGTRYIAIALGQQSFRGMSEVDITLGNNSTTRCDIHNQEEKRLKRATPTDEDYIGQNGPLSQEKSYNIYLVTSTPSDTEVFFQISQPLVVNAMLTESTTVESNVFLIIAIVAGGCVLFVILIVGLILGKRRFAANQVTRKNNRNTTTPSNERHAQVLYENNPGDVQPNAQIVVERETAIYVNDRQYEEIETPQYAEINLERNQDTEYEAYNEGGTTARM